MKIKLDDIELVECTPFTEVFDNKEFQTTTNFSIMYNGVKVGEIRTLVTSLNLKYIEYIEIYKQYQNNGIATYLLAKYFKGYFISAGNTRVISLYNRIGRDQTRFTDDECRVLAYNTGMYGTFIIE